MGDLKPGDLVKLDYKVKQTRVTLWESFDPTDWNSVCKIDHHAVGLVIAIRPHNRICNVLMLVNNTFGWNFTKNFEVISEAG